MGSTGPPNCFTVHHGISGPSGDYHPEQVIRDYSRGHPGYSRPLLGTPTLSHSILSKRSKRECYIRSIRSQVPIFDCCRCEANRRERIMNRAYVATGLFRFIYSNASYVAVIICPRRQGADVLEPGSRLTLILDMRAI